MREPSQRVFSRSVSHAKPDELAIAVIGCGAIAESFYLPAVMKNKDVAGNVVLVDNDQTRLEAVSARFNVPHRATDYRTILGKVKGAIIAVPHYLHHKISIDFLRNGAHVLCEKPLAETAGEGREMVEQARTSHVTISVNNTRRLYPAYGKIKELIQNQFIGDLISIQFTNGFVFQWPTASGFYFSRRNGRPKGVLLDQGAHVLDLICWWMGHKPQVIGAQNDSFGGSEAEERLFLKRESCDIEVILSWLSPLRNRYRIVGDQGIIEGDIEDFQNFDLANKDGRSRRVKVRCKEKGYREFAERLLGNFVSVLRNEAQPLIPAEEVLPSIELIEECYEASTKLSMPWYDDLEVLHGR